MGSILAIMSTWEAGSESFSSQKDLDDPYMVFMYVNVKLNTHLFSICAASSQPE